MAKKVVTVVENREKWLTNCAEIIAPRIEDIAGKTFPDFHISVGFPSRRALSKKKRVIGQCFNQKLVGKNGRAQIFISPLIITLSDVVGTVAHECCHIFASGHRKEFTRLAFGIGLVGKPTEAGASPQFMKELEPKLDKLGQYPHTALVVNPSYKPQSTYLLACECPTCGYLARVTKKWIEAVGAPICPIDKVAMTVG